jgi:peptide/nickel transport system substrate-binding protein
MRNRRLVLGAGLIGVALAVAACSGSSGGNNAKNNNNNTNGNNTASAKSGGTLKVVEGTFPDSLDPQFGYTTQAAEADAMVYTPLLQYAAKTGTAGTQLVPGLAKALPTVSSDQKTYTLQLRSGLKYSDGTAVKASDFTHAIERACKISWGGKSFYTNYIVGAADYDKGKASTISGIQTNDSTGQITIHLTQPYGAFPNLIAFPSSAPVPSSTPMKVLSNTPPVGVGPYKFGKIVPNSSYELIKNTAFSGFGITDVPSGFVDKVEVTKNTNTNTEAQQVLDNQADIFDPGDALPAGALQKVQTQAKDRYQKVPVAATYYFFMNTAVAPFNNAAARKAVAMATDRQAIARLSSGALVPGCNFLPPTIVGHKDGSCAGIDPNAVPSSSTIAQAKQLIKNAGLAGTRVTVWSETRSPRQEYCTYLNGLLNQLGFKSTLKVIQDTVYFQTIGNRKLNAQVGFADWSQDFPNPSDFYLLLSKTGIQDTNNENFGNVSDPQIESQLAQLNPIPATKLASAQSGWQNLDAYVASKYYVDVYGYLTAPKFTSNRVDFASAQFSPVYYLLYNTIQLKS